MTISSGISCSNADHFQIFSEHRGAISPRSIVGGPQCFEFMTKRLTSLDIERRELLMSRSVVETEELHHLRGSKGITKRIVPSDQTEIR